MLGAMTMATCDFTGCTGHLGKFQSCLAEAIWEQSLDFPEDQTGSTEFEGHFALMIYGEADNQKLEDGRVVPIPAGSYIVQSAESGAVYLLEFPDEAAARATLDGHRQKYEKWEDSD